MAADCRYWFENLSKRVKNNEEMRAIYGKIICKVK